MLGESPSSVGEVRARPWRSAGRRRPATDAPPLAGVRVLDLATALAAPLAAGILAEQGADVIKIEPPGSGDVLRHVGPAVGGVSGIYQMTNRSKRAGTVDIGTEAGRGIVLELAAGADIVFCNFRPGVADRLGVSYEHLRAVNPDVIVVSVTGFGPTGPYADRPAYDGIIQAASGYRRPRSGRRHGRAAQSPSHRVGQAHRSARRAGCHRGTAGAGAGSGRSACGGRHARGVGVVPLGGRRRAGDPARLRRAAALRPGRSRQADGLC